VIFGIGVPVLNLLVPVEMEPALGGTSAMVLELDQGSAAIPWEMLDTKSGNRQAGDHRPWAIRTKLLRKLQLVDFRQQPRDASRASQVLVIGEPLCDNPGFPRLPGARAEARAVRDRLGAGEGHVTLTDEAGLVVAVAVLMKRVEQPG